MSNFFSRPRLADNQFRQLTGDTLNLSGTTNFKGVLKSKDVEIDGGLNNATGGTITSKYVLTLDGTKIRLRPNDGGGTTVFNSNRNTTRSGVPSVFVGGNTVTDFLEGYFFPAIPPASIISISSGGSDRQFGDGTIGSLSWTAVRNTNPITQIQLDTNGNGIYNLNVTVVNGNTQSGSVAYALTNSDYNPVSGTLTKSRTYSLKTSTATENAVSTASIMWRHKRYWFSNINPLTSADAITIQGILNSSASSELTTSKAKTFSPITFVNQYFYYAIPSFFGVPAFTVNGLPNNAWGNLGTGTLFTISFTNSNGYTETYYIAKSDQSMSNTFNIIST